MGSNKPGTENVLIEQGMDAFPLLSTSDLALYLRTEHIELAHLSLDALRCRIKRIKESTASVKKVIIRLPSGDIEGKLVGCYVIPIT